MSKYISVIGGTGYVGRRCIETLLRCRSDVKVFSIARNPKLDMLNKYGERVEFIKANAHDPNSYSDYINRSVGVIHTVGKLISTSKEGEDSYDNINCQTALSVAKIANDLGTNGNKKNFVYVSAERGLAFPLSLCFDGYINSKRKAEQHLLKDYPNLNVVVLRPGVINDMKERPYLMPLSIVLELNQFMEKNIINKIFPGAGEKLNLPPGNIQLDTLAMYCVAGGLGKLTSNTIYTNDYMNDLKNLSRINF